MELQRHAQLWIILLMQNKFATDAQHQIGQKTNQITQFEEMKLQTFGSKDNLERNGQNLKECFPGIGHWLDRKKDPTKKEGRCSRCCWCAKKLGRFSPEALANYGVKPEKCGSHVDTRALNEYFTKGSGHEAGKTTEDAAADSQVLSLRSVSTHPKAYRGTAFNSYDDVVSGRVRHYGRQGSSTRVRDRQPRDSVHYDKCWFEKYCEPPLIAVCFIPVWLLDQCIRYTCDGCCKCLSKVGCFCCCH